MLALVSCQQPGTDDDGGGGVYMTRNLNADFSQGGYSDWDDVYESADDIGPYLNVPVTGDFIAGWTLEIGIGFMWSGQWFNISIGPTLVSGQANEAVYLAQENPDSSDGVTTSLRQTLSYTVKASSKIHIRYRIDESNCETGDIFHQAPLKILLNIGESEYLYKIYGQDSTIEDGRTIVTQGTWNEDTIPLPGLTSVGDSPHTIVVGDTISQMTAQCHEWGYKVYIDDFTLLD